MTALKEYSALGGAHVLRGRGVACNAWEVLERRRGGPVKKYAIVFEGLYDGLRCIDTVEAVVECIRAHAEGKPLPQHLLRLVSP